MSDLPEQVVLKDERAREIHQAIQKLPAHQIAVIELHHYQHLSYKEIAEQLELPINTVKSHIFRARKSLAKYLRSN